MAKNVVTLDPASVAALATAAAEAVGEVTNDGNGFTRVPVLHAASGDHTVSAGVTKVDLEAWGGGGSSSADGQSASGAGGGYAAKYNVTVTPGQVLTVVVGAGGAINAGFDDGLPGGLSKVSNAVPTVLVEAGGGGGAAPTGNPAAGGAVTVGDFGVVGGPGATGGGAGGLIYNHGGAGGNGGAGGSGIGNAAGQRAAAVPGGGGGGATGTNGMAGAAGRVIVWEYRPVA